MRRSNIVIHIVAPCSHEPLISNLEVPPHKLIRDLKQDIETRLKTKAHFFDLFNGDLSQKYTERSLEDNSIKNGNNLCFVTRNLPKGVGRISGADNHTCAIAANGKVYCWGNKRFGKLGLGDQEITGKTSAPHLVPFSKEAIMVACGNIHTVALLEDGSVWSWGRNLYGQLGILEKEDKNLPVRVNLEGKAKMISAGAEHTLFLLENDLIYSCGSNKGGRLGRIIPRGKPELKRIPGHVKLPDSDKSSVIMIASGNSHNLALSQKGLYAWGENNMSGLGVEDLKKSALPILIDLPEHKIPRFISAQEYSSYAIGEDGSFYKWGLFRTYQDNEYGKKEKTPRLIKAPQKYKGILSFKCNCAYVLFGDGSLLYGGIRNGNNFIEFNAKQPGSSPFPPKGRKIIFIFNGNRWEENDIFLILDDFSIWSFKSEENKPPYGLAKFKTKELKPIQVL